MDGIYLTQNREERRASLKVEMKFSFSQEAGNFLNSSKTKLSAF